MRKSEESGADVAVVGGGVAGLSAARELARRGLSVILLENAEPGAEASCAAAGMLAPQAEADGRDEFFELLCASREMYPTFAEQLLEESGVSIELDRTGTLYLALTEEDVEEIERRFAWQSRAKLAVERLSAEEARRLEPRVSTRVRAALRFPRDWQVESRRLVAALAASASVCGARLLMQTAASGVRVVAGRAVGVETPRGFLSAGAVVLAAGARTSHVPLLVSEREGVEARAELSLHPRIEPVRGQMLCLRQPTSSEPFVSHVVYSPRGYLVPRRDGRLLAGSTSERIASNALEIAPEVAALRLADSWAGLRPRAADGLPVLGESPEVKNLFYATGHYRNGILLAPATGEIIADLLTGGTTKLLPRALEAFSPLRFRRALVGSHGN
ncbi:MAG: glycine oxidase ThiO [Acidobacteria bacterium]|nr:MAG: glycine oxidase ThiO [Acidobacteriota bacterium]